MRLRGHMQVLHGADAMQHEKPRAQVDRRSHLFCGLEHNSLPAERLVTCSVVDGHLKAQHVVDVLAHLHGHHGALCWEAFTAERVKQVCTYSAFTPKTYGAAAAAPRAGNEVAPFPIAGKECVQVVGGCRA